MRRVLPLAALVFSLGVVTLVANDSASADPADERAFVAAVNAERAAAGLPALVVDGQLTDAARNWAQSMAAAGQISHAPDITVGVTADWLKMGENVGVGPDVDSIMRAFMASPTHRANVVDPEFTHVGVGVVWANGAMYTVHRFMKVAASPATTAPPPPPTTASPPVATEAPQIAIASPPTTVSPVPGDPTPVASSPVPSDPTPTTTTPVPVIPTTGPPAPDAGPDDVTSDRSGRRHAIGSPMDPTRVNRVLVAIRDAA